MLVTATRQNLGPKAVDCGVFRLSMRGVHGTASELDADQQPASAASAGARVFREAMGKHVLWSGRAG